VLARPPRPLPFAEGPCKSSLDQSVSADGHTAAPRQPRPEELLVRVPRAPQSRTRAITLRMQLHYFHRNAGGPRPPELNWLEPKASRRQVCTHAHYSRPPATLPAAGEAQPTQNSSPAALDRARAPRLLLREDLSLVERQAPRHNLQQAPAPLLMLGPAERDSKPNFHVGSGRRGPVC